MSELVEIVKAQLTEEYERQKASLIEQRDVNDALAQLEQRYKSIVEQVDILEHANAPVDLIAWYVKTGGKVWVSKKVGLNGSFQGLNITNMGMNLIPGEDFKLPMGLYRLVLLAIPEDVPEDMLRNMRMTDDYGITIQIIR